MLQYQALLSSLVRAMREMSILPLPLPFCTKCSDAVTDGVWYSWHYEEYQTPSVTASDQLVQNGKGKGKIDISRMARAWGPPSPGIVLC
jgi:hypothetical protein